MSTVIAKNIQIGADTTATNNFTIYQPATPNGTLLIGNGNTGITSSLVALTSAGNLGVGTSSPALPLHVYNADAALAYFESTSANGPYVIWRSSGTSIGDVGSSKGISGAGAATDFMIASRSSPLLFGTGSTERMRLDSSGNLGLGVTPSAWASGTYKVFQVSGGGAISGSTGQVNFSQNWVGESGADKYIATAAASSYSQALGAHKWFNAPSGTAGNAITFTQAMTLDASGNLLVGQTSGSSRISVTATGTNYAGYFSYSNSGQGVGINSVGVGTTYAMYFFNNSTNVGGILTSSTTTSYITSSDYRLKNITGPITTSGAYIDSLNPVEGTWKADGSTFVGLIAHEAQEASRTQVATGIKDGEQMQGMDYSSAEIIANLIAELQSVRQRLAALEAA